jgi:hypothetical protein
VAILLSSAPIDRYLKMDLTFGKLVSESVERMALTQGSTVVVSSILALLTFSAMQVRYQDGSESALIRI